MCKVIAIMNEKGGVAKTTTAKNLSVGLAMKNKKVLLIDLDPSGNLTKAMGMEQHGDDHMSNGTICDIFDALINLENEEDIDSEFGILHQEEGVDIVTSSNTLHIYESKLNDTYRREEVLKQYVDVVKDNYDFVLMDCPAGLGIFVTNALFCADYVLIPLQAQVLAVQAMQNIFVEILKVRRAKHTMYEPKILGIFFSAVRPYTMNDKSIMFKVRADYDGDGKPYVFKTYIPQNTKISESDAAHQSIFKYDPKSTAAYNYEDLTNEVLSRLEDMDGGNNDEQ